MKMQLELGTSGASLSAVETYVDGARHPGVAKAQRQDKIRTRRDQWWSWPSWSRAQGTTSADVTAVAKSFGEIPPLGLAKHSDTTESDLVKSSGGAGHSWSRVNGTTSADATKVSEAEVPEIIIVSDAVEGTFVNLDGESFQEEQKRKHQRKLKRTRGVDRTEKIKEEKRLWCALLQVRLGAQKGSI